MKSLVKRYIFSFVLGGACAIVAFVVLGYFLEGYRADQLEVAVRKGDIGQIVEAVKFTKIDGIEGDLSPLEIAAQSNQFEAFQCLLILGANPNPNGDGQLIMTAIRNKPNWQSALDAAKKRRLDIGIENN